MQWDAWLSVVLPIKRFVDHDRFGHAPGVVAKITCQIFLLISHHVAEHFIGPIHVAGDRFRVRIDQQLRVIETQALFRIVLTGNAITIQLTRPRVRQEDVPDIISSFRYRNADVFLARIDTIE